MPLTRARDRYTVHADGILFLMRDGPFEMICHIELETLSPFGNASDLGEAVDFFERNRGAIEGAASNKYDRTSRWDYEILVVVPADLGCYG
jgi:Protein of unknown function (DUF1488)